MSNVGILEGKWIWIWYVKNVQQDIALAREVGARGVIIKSADGSGVWPQFAAHIAEYRAVGLKVAAFNYLYGDDVEGELKAAEAAINAGADFLTLDVEMQYAKKSAQAKEFASRLRASKPDAIITLSPWCFPDAKGWIDVPYTEFIPYVDAILPQNYWGDYVPHVDQGLRMSDKQIGEWKKPIFPIGQVYSAHGYEPTAESYQLFEKTCHELGYKGVSFWRSDTMTGPMKQAVKAMQFPVSVAPAPQPVVIHDEPLKPVPKPPVPAPQPEPQPSPEPAPQPTAWDKLAAAGWIEPQGKTLLVNQEQLAKILEKAGLLK